MPARFILVPHILGIENWLGALRSLYFFAALCGKQRSAGDEVSVAERRCAKPFVIASAGILDWRF